MKLFRKKMNFQHGYMQFYIGPSQKQTVVDIIYDDDGRITAFVDGKMVEFER